MHRDVELFCVYVQALALMFSMCNTHLCVWVAVMLGKGGPLWNSQVSEYDDFNKAQVSSSRENLQNTVQQ